MLYDRTADNNDVLFIGNRLFLTYDIQIAPYHNGSAPSAEKARCFRHRSAYARLLGTLGPSAHCRVQIARSKPRSRDERITLSISV